MLIFQIVQGFEELFTGFRLELGNAHIAVTVFNHPGFDAGYLDDIAGYINLDRRGFAFAHDGQREYRAGLAAHQVDGFFQRHALHRFFIQLDNQVAGLHARLLGRGVVDGGNDFHKAVFHAHFNAQATKLAGGAFFQLFVVFRGQVGGVWIQV